MFGARRPSHTFAYTGAALLLVFIALWIYGWESLWMTRRYLHFVVHDEYAVFSSSINAIFASEKVKPKALLVLDETDPDSMHNLKDVWYAARNEGHMLALAQTTIDDFTSQNAAHHRLYGNINASAKCIPLGWQRLEVIVGNDASNWGRRIKSEYPEAEFVIHLSRVGFNSDFSQAIIWLRFEEIPSGGGGGTYLLLGKRNDAWVVIDGYRQLIM